MTKNNLSKVRKQKNNKKIPRLFRQWHRHIGIFTAFFLIFLSVTGIALNHTDSLSLSHIKINNKVLLDYYGIKNPKSTKLYSFEYDKNQQTISVTDNLVWLNEHLLVEVSSEVVSVSSIKALGDTDIIVVSCTDEILLFNTSGDQIDKLGVETGLPHPIVSTGVRDDVYVIQTETGYYQTDTDFYQWSALSTENVVSSSVKKIRHSQLNEETVFEAQQRFKAQFLTLERLIIDGHSGRLFGIIGVLFMDLVALLLILMSVSGVYIWFKQGKKK